MEYWEFLLQGEGDDNWLPLDTSQVEILEGRYRLMAHTSHTNTAVNIRISQFLLDQTPPKRRSLKRQGQTNNNGLLVVMPFTRLTAGTWDIHCASPASSAEAASSAWRYGVQLQVLPSESSDDEDWFADDGTAQLPASAATPVAPEAFPGSTATQTADLDLEQVSAAITQNSQEQTPESTTAVASAYHVNLSQTALVAKQGQAISLPVQIIGSSDEHPEADTALAIRLLDPQNASIIVLQTYYLVSAALPATVSLPVALPDDLSTRLLLGEVALLATQAEPITVLDLQRFTVTVDLASLFDAIADQAETADDLDVIFPPDVLGTEKRSDSTAKTATDDATALPWENVALFDAPPRAVPTITLPRGGFSLPPKIYYPSPHEAQARTPVLPPFGKPKSTAKPAPSTAPEVPPDEALEAPNQSSETVTPSADADASPTTPEHQPTEQKIPEPSAPASPEPSAPATLEQAPTPESPEHKPPATPAPPPKAAEQQLTLPPIPRPKSAVEAASDASLSSDAEASPQPKAQVPLLPSHEDMGFRDLKLQERFWSRLNDLAVNIQQEAQQQREQAEAIPDLTPQPDAGPEFIPFAGEVVIYEDEDETLGAFRAMETDSHLTDSLTDDEDEIISPPAPDIELPEGELTAGETVILTLRVPFHANRLYLKVWIVDPQTRDLADEPRQIMHLAPDGRGHLEGSVQMTVPQGCLEAWFEAIAVDMLTQQESYKTSVSRPVVPAGVASPPLDEFDL